MGSIHYGEHPLWGASIMGSINHGEHLSWGASIVGSIDYGEHLSWGASIVGSMIMGSIYHGEHRLWGALMLHYKYKHHCDSGSLDHNTYLKRFLRAPPCLKIPLLNRPFH